MRKIPLLFLICLLALPALAQHVSREEALNKALTFINQSANSRSFNPQQPRMAADLQLANDREEFYVFNDEANGGYFIMSGDKRLPSVLGYSYDGRYDADSLPDNMRAWLENYAEQVHYMQSHSDRQAAAGDAAATREPIAPMLDCQWSQFYPYNTMCPKIGGSNTVTGCVATAMAQIMYYYKWPKKTKAVIPGYVTKTERIQVESIPVTTIDWDNMLPTYSGNSYSDKQADAVALLMKLCGAAVEMGYKLNGSGASLSATPLADYFDYEDAQNVSRSSKEDEDWEDIIYGELSEGHPIFYTGQHNSDGHAWVVDGYDGKGYYHMNWGWGGSNNGYFILSQPMGYTDKQAAVVNFYPNTPDYLHAYAELKEGTLTFYYDKEKENRQGSVFPLRMNKETHHHWYAASDEITEVVIDPSFAGLKLYTLLGWFESLTQVKTIQGLEYMNTRHVANMGYMFQRCTSLTHLDLSNFDTGEVEDMTKMFDDCWSLASLDISRFDTKNVTYMGGMFSGCGLLTHLDVSNFNTEKVVNMAGMFYDCSSLTNLDVSHFETKNVTTMYDMFSRCSSLTDLDVSHFNTENVASMSNMFKACEKVTSLDVSHFDTKNVTGMSYMFSGCNSLASLDLSNFNTEKVLNMERMFTGCESLTSLDLSSFNTKNVTSMNGMFFNCPNLTTIYCNDTWTADNSDDMFFDCTSLKGAVPYDETKTDVSMANPETGYFTKKTSDGIQAVGASEAGKAPWYDLNGRKLLGAPTQQGIYIRGGRKVHIK